MESNNGNIMQNSCVLIPSSMILQVTYNKDNIYNPVAGRI
jgi:hypothetical protein